MTDQATASRRPVFIVGTGCCGTTQLNRIIGEHPDFYAFDHELRFWSDPGGLRELVDALTTRWDPYTSAAAIDRLEELLRVTLAGAGNDVFTGWNLPGEVGIRYYWPWVESLIASVTDYTFVETGYPDSGVPRYRTRRVGTRFADRKALLELLRRSVDGLLMPATLAHGGQRWCDKTPWNLLAIPFLHELYPEARFLHIVRHPYEVLKCHIDQEWAPESAEKCARWLRGLYERWFEVRAAMDTSVALLQFTLEEAAADWPATRSQIFKFLDVPDVETPSRLDGDRVRHRRDVLSDGDKVVVRSELAAVAGALGYEVREP